MQYSQVANSLVDKGKIDEAKQLLEKCDRNMLPENFPYAMASRREQQNQISAQFLLAAYRAGDTVLAKKISNALRTDLEQQIMYFNSLNENRQQYLAYDNQIVTQLLQQLQGMEQYFTKPLMNLPSPESTNKVITNTPALQNDTQPHDKP
jgi:predicted site-specific integrase-resolvase